MPHCPAQRAPRRTCTAATAACLSARQPTKRSSAQSSVACRSSHTTAACSTDRWLCCRAHPMASGAMTLDMLLRFTAVSNTTDISTNVCRGGRQEGRQAPAKHPLDIRQTRPTGRRRAGAAIQRRTADSVEQPRPGRCAHEAHATRPAASTSASHCAGRAHSPSWRCNHLNPLPTITISPILGRSGREQRGRQ